MEGGRKGRGKSSISVNLVAHRLFISVALPPSAPITPSVTHRIVAHPRLSRDMRYFPTHLR